MIHAKTMRLHRALRGALPKKLRIRVGASWREFQRKKGKLLSGSAEVLASSLRKSLNANGYGLNLEGEDQFEILLLCTSNDFFILEENLRHIQKRVSKKCQRISIIVNKNAEILINRINLNKWENIFVIDETRYEKEVLQLQKSIDQFNPMRQNWILQQCLKTLFVVESDLPVLIIDSDTFVNSDINFIGQNVQLLYAGNDFHFPYSRHINKFLKVYAIGLSFVHHVQLQQPHIVREIYGSDVVIGLRRWLQSGLAQSEPSPISEFQTYGDYILRNYPESVKLFFHNHHFQDAAIFKLNFMLSLELALSPHLQNCDCHLITLSNKHLLIN